jgi:hypothetical protein
MIYSPACSLYDQSIVWSGRMADDDNEFVFRRDHGPATGSDAVTIAAIHSRCYAQEALDKIPTFE